MTKKLTWLVAIVLGLMMQAQAQLGYDLDNIIYTEGTTNPIADISSFSEAYLTSDSTLDIVNWNVDWLGDPTMTSNVHGTRSQHIYKVAAKLVAMDADIIALQEVVISETLGLGNALEDLISDMNYEAGSNKYAGVWSDFHSFYWNEDSEDYPPQCMAFVYNTETVSVNQDSALLQDVASSQNFGGGRLPYLLDCDVTINGITQRYMVINLHLKAQTGYSSRRASSMKLLRSLLNANFYQNNVVVVGDFNVADDGGAVGEIADWGYYDDYEEDGLCDYVHAGGNKTSAYHDIEHLLVSTELFDELAYVPESLRSVEVDGTDEDGYSSHSAFVTSLYIHETSGDYDPENNEITNTAGGFTMLSSDYQIIVDYSNAQGTNTLENYPETSENYYGASGYYGNFDIATDGSWNQDAFGSWEEAVQTGIIVALLPATYPNATASDTVYTIEFDTWDGSSSGTSYFDFICTQSAPDPVFAVYTDETNVVKGVSSQKLTVYPNPAREVLYIQNSDAESVAILNSIGRLVLQSPATNQQLDISSLPSGLYILQVGDEALRFVKE